MKLLYEVFKLFKWLCCGCDADGKRGKIVGGRRGSANLNANA
jgi:hypothetical protein